MGGAISGGRRIGGAMPGRHLPPAAPHIQRQCITTSPQHARAQQQHEAANQPAEACSQPQVHHSPSHPSIIHPASCSQHTLHATSRPSHSVHPSTSGQRSYAWPLLHSTALEGSRPAGLRPARTGSAQAHAKFHFRGVRGTDPGSGGSFAGCSRRAKGHGHTGVPARGGAEQAVSRTTHNMCMHIRHTRPKQ